MVSILKLIEFRERFEAEKTFKEDDAYDRFSKVDTVSKQLDFYGGSRKRRHEETSEYTIRGVTTARKSAKPKFF